MIDVKKKTYAPPTLNFSLTMDGSDIDDVHFSLGGRLTIMDVGKYGSEWRNDVRIGYRALLASEYLYPLGGKGFYVAPRVYFARGLESFFSPAGSRAADYQVNKAAGSMDMVFMTRRSEFRTGYEFGRFNADVHTGTPPLTSVSGQMSHGTDALCL